MPGGEGAKTQGKESFMDPLDSQKVDEQTLMHVSANERVQLCLGVQ